MGAFGHKRGFVWLVLAGLLYFSTVPTSVFADEKDGRTPSPKANTGTVSPAMASALPSAATPQEQTPTKQANAGSFAFTDFPTWLNDILATAESPWIQQRSGSTGPRKQRHRLSRGVQIPKALEALSAGKARTTVAKMC